MSTASLRLLLTCLLLDGCATAPATPSGRWPASLPDAHALAASGALFQLGLDAPPVPIPIADHGSGPAAGSGAGHGTGGSSGASPTPPPPPSGGGGHGGGGSSAPATPPPAAVLSNTLDAGPGAIAGVVLDVLHGGRPVPNTLITIVSADDPTKQAVVRNGPDGYYRLGGIALGTYRVLGARSGFVASRQAVEGILYPSAPEVTTVNLSLSPL